MDKNKIIQIKRNSTEEEQLELANKIKVVSDLANEGIITQKERLRIIKKLIGE